MNKVYIGIDTSNYTTSVAAVTSDNQYFSVKEPLTVEYGKLGVRQSDAVFLHTKNIPTVVKRLFSLLRGKLGEDLSVSAVGVSSKPRPLENSYMPCFLSGVAIAESIAIAENIPLYTFSHQEGHIRSAIFGAGINVPDRFYSFHLSGGTCELLENTKISFGFESRIISQTLDITLGQLVDRVGVMLGLSFPAGVMLENLAIKSDKKYKVNIKGNENINLSGFQNKAEKMLVDKVPFEDIASFVYSVIMTSVERMLQARGDNTIPVIFAGGVSGSAILQKYVKSICNAHFACPELSSDNAVGVSLLAKEKFEKVSVNV